MSCDRIPSRHASPPSSDQASVTDHARWLTDEVRPHESALRGYLRNHFPSIEADDVVQESYLKLMKARATGKIASAKAFFFTVARNTALTFFRRQRIYSETPVCELPTWRVLDGTRDSVDAVNDRQQFDVVIEVIDKLPRRCREIVTLAAVEGLSNAEIAARLDLCEVTVRVQMARGIVRIAEYLAKRGRYDQIN